MHKLSSEVLQLYSMQYIVYTANSYTAVFKQYYALMLTLTSYDICGLEVIFFNPVWVVLNS